jgi:glucose-6-phosphate isomerase
MALQSINPTKTKAWKKLREHYNAISDKHILSFFNEDVTRAENFSIQWNDFLVDYSKNRINQETLNLLLELAEECQLKDAIHKYFQGDIINQTEGRAVLHTALRSKENEIFVDGKNIIPEIAEVKGKIKTFSEAVISGNKKGYSGKPFTDVVNIGIGGSDLGPAMVTNALAFYKNHLNIHFVSNVDGDHVHETLKKLNPATTLFVIVSKSFTTQETLTNANTIRKWFVANASEQAVQHHFVAVSTNLPETSEFGVLADHVFPMWDWVGGRFSLWSAVGLSIALSVGYNHFEELLEGAQEMDVHFKETKFSQNIPVILALLSIWYNNFFNAESEAIIPYTQYLQYFPAYLQQAVMESNGKSVDRSGNEINYQTGTLIWGAPGTNSQHAFFQLLHQGTKLVPTDFIGFIKPLHDNTEHHNKLMANFFAQTEALMCGKTKEVVLKELQLEAKEKIEKALPFKVFKGNKPTNTILIHKLSPKTLGALIAMYEHKIFVQGVIWNIFSYDQWGVELGKQLANTILKDFSTKEVSKHDASTYGLVNFYRKNR